MQQDLGVGVWYEMCGLWWSGWLDLVRSGEMWRNLVECDVLWIERCGKGEGCRGVLCAIWWDVVGCDGCGEVLFCGLV